MGIHARIEINQKVEVALLGMEAIFGGGPKQIQLIDMVLLAKTTQIVKAVVDKLIHSVGVGIAWLESV